MLLKIFKNSDKTKVNNYINRLPDGKRYTVEVKLKRENRSIDQNRLYWLWISCISEETGNDRDTLHELFKQMYLGSEERIALNCQVAIRRSTSRLDTKEFTDYLNRIQQFVNTELGIILPNPEDLIWDDFYAFYKDHI
ncbi:MAG: recombination protein NinB [Tannerella sp.]|jgi:hypothetical protein|nr:recombination protein NinB [Tannerella sp.]